MKKMIEGDRSRSAVAGAIVWAAAWLSACGGKSAPPPASGTAGDMGSGDTGGPGQGGDGPAGSGQPAGTAGAGGGAGTRGAAGTNGSAGTPGDTGGSTDATVVSLATGQNHLCSVLTDGTVWCWGGNNNGQLGNTSTTASTDPVQVRNLAGKAIAVAAGAEYSCAVLADGTAQCWGIGRYGALGNGATLNSLIPVTVTGLTGATAIAAGQGTVCAIVPGGAVSCWGQNYEGSLGSGSTTTSTASTPVQVLGLTGAKAITSGYGYSCVITATGTVQCWGYNGYGVLGTGGNQSSPVPVNVMGLSAVAAISAGKTHACALLADTTIHCWGDNGRGQLGTGATASSYTPVPVYGVTGAVAVSASFDNSYTCAVIGGGRVECWGANDYRQLGDGTTKASLMPILVAGTGLGGAVSVGASGGQACAVFTDGTYQCWGNG